MKTKITVISQFCISVLTVLGLTLGGVATAQETPAGKSSSVSAKDKTFMKKAATGGMMEVAMGRLAEQKAQSEDVKSFGKRMVTDHSKANDELKKIAAQKNVKLPAKEPTVSWSSDKAYMDMMVKDHEKDLAEFQEEAKSGSDADVKKFAVPTLKSDLAFAAASSIFSFDAEDQSHLYPRPSNRKDRDTATVNPERG